MRPAHRDIVITGLGAVSAAGESCDELWASVEQGRGGIAPIQRFSTDGFDVHTGAIVKNTSTPGAVIDATVTEALCLAFAERAGREAMAHAGLDRSSVDPARIALAFGTGLGDLERPVNLMAEDLARSLGIVGPCLTVSTACSSSTGAIGLGRDLIAMGAADVVVAGGADVLTPEVFAGFHALGVLTAGKCAPFSLPFGTTLGEGAGFLVLERGDQARERGVETVAALSGYGLSGDAWHETSPDPKGGGVDRAIRGALGDALLDAADIGYVNAHGSGTEANDAAEWQGIQRGLGAHARTIPVSSSKGCLGHGQGAAGVLEAIVTILCMRRGLVPPTLNFASPRAQSPADPVHASLPRPLTYDRALSVNAAFGGANASIILSSRSAGDRKRERKAVTLLGYGAAYPHDSRMSRAGDERREDHGESGRTRRTLEDLVPTADTRGLDPTSRALTAAAALALADAGARVRGDLRDRTGLVVGQLHASPSAARAFRRSIDERGLRGLSATAFARIVLNAAAGSCSKLLSLRGPHSAITTGASSGLVALVLGCEMLATRDEVDLMVTGAATETRGPADDEPGDGAAVCLVLGKDAGAGRTSGQARMRIAGWGLAGPGCAAEAATYATRDHHAAPYRIIDLCSEASSAEYSHGTSLLDGLTAIGTLRAGEAECVLVTADSGSMSAAIVIAA